MPGKKGGYNLQLREVGMSVKNLCVAKGLITGYPVQGIDNAGEESFIAVRMNSGKKLVYLRSSLVEVQLKEVGVTVTKFV
jgi:hypothetical protein